MNILSKNPLGVFDRISKNSVLSLTGPGKNEVIQFSKLQLDKKNFGFFMNNFGILLVKTKSDIQCYRINDDYQKNKKLTLENFTIDNDTIFSAYCREEENPIIIINLKSSLSGEIMTMFFAPDINRATIYNHVLSTAATLVYS